MHEAYGEEVMWELERRAGRRPAVSRHHDAMTTQRRPPHPAFSCRIVPGL